ncbi:MAG: acetyl-CoA carboxylase biotin carboxyl carrier protein subunit [Bdellovibrionaceae bacterium]|nr:acetyl-CoA carboxylase biotin carboxyl carrier protein subunit [Pseudobdellovibrionaceae bacterium]
MQFEAKSNGIQYKISVREERKNWVVSIKTENEDWVKHVIPKEDYQVFDRTICFIYKNSSYLIDVIGKGINYEVYTRGSYRTLELFNDEMLLHESLKGNKGLSGGNSLGSGMPGKIVKVLVKEGEEVKEGQAVIIMEAMKMENEMRSGRDAKIKKIHVKEGDSVEGGATLVTYY